MKTLWVLSTIFSFVWTTINNSLRILTLKTIVSILIEKVKYNCDDSDGLMLFNEETVEVLEKLYESLEKQEASLDKLYW